MPYIRRLPNRADGSKGRWQATVRHPSGRKVTKTDALKRVVEAWAAEQEAAFRTGSAPLERGRSITVSQWAERWMESRNVEPITAKKDRSQINTHVLPHWGRWPLQSIGRLDVQSWVKGMTAAGIGANTVVGAYHRFAAMLSDAVLEGLIGTSPCREIDLPKVVRPTPRWLTRDEYDRIQAALAVTPRAPVWQAYVGLACFSGLRPGELAGLDVRHLDLRRSLVHAGQQVQTRVGLRDYGKSESATRVVPFPDEVGDLLRRAVAQRATGPVFTSPSGDRVNEANFRNRVWRPALLAAEVEYARPYITRHTAASWLVQAGVPPIEIVRMLGHSSMALVNTYLHLAPDQHDRIRTAWEQPSRRTGGATG